MASAVKRILPFLDVEIVDGNLLGQAEMERRILAEPGDLVGISVHTTFAYPNALHLAEALTHQQTPIVLGGFHATALARQIVRHRGFDVIAGAGEVALPAYLAGRRQQVPGLHWLEEGSVRSNPRTYEPPPWTHKLDPSLIDSRPYSKRLRSRLPAENKNFSGYLFFTHQGCRWRDTPTRAQPKRGGCTFCSLPARHLLPSDPRIIWDEVSRIKNAWKTPLYLKDYGDCFSGSWPYARSFADARPVDLRPGIDYLLEVYIKPGELREQWQTDLLKHLGVHRVFVGFESASQRVLRAMNKGSTPRLHRLCAELLVRAGIEINASFVLGCETEDRASVAETMQFAEDLATLAGPLLRCAGASPLAVMPGSLVYQKLAHHVPRLAHLDEPPIHELQLAWIKNFCGPDLAREPRRALRWLEEQATRIGALAPIGNFVGWTPRLEMHQATGPPASRLPVRSQPVSPPRNPSP